MAKVTLNALTTHLRGMVGDVVFKKINGKLHVTRRPGPRRTKPKAAEKRKMKRFAAAHRYGQKVLRDPELKAEYAAIAKQRGGRIYNLAMSDFLTFPTVDSISHSHRDPPPEDIHIFTPNDYKIVAMHLILRDAAGQVIERGEPVQSRKIWTYRTTQPRRTGEPLTIEVTAADRFGKTTTRKVDVVFKA